MKNLIFTLLCATICLPTVNAQWQEPTGILAPPLEKATYHSEIEAGLNGDTWILNYVPNNDLLEIRLQKIDADGNSAFDGNGILLSDYPNLSYTVTNDLLHIDNEGNAIAIARDLRNNMAGSSTCYTAYKVAPDGSMLWGDDGILIGEETYALCAAMDATVLDDNSIVFAWSWFEANGSASYVEAMRLSADGEAQWNLGDLRIGDGIGSYMYPYVVDAGYNQFILVYCKGEEIYARKCDFDGTSVWGGDVCVYDEGFANSGIPLWTILDVQPSGDGGVLVAWNDDRNFTNIESAYLAYITPSGSIGFVSENGQKLGYAGWRSFNVKVLPGTADSDSFLAIWRETDVNQNYSRINTQLLSKQGELLYSEEGSPLSDMEQLSNGYLSVLPGPDGQAAIFYMKKIGGFGDVDAYMSLIDIETGSKIWENDYRLTAEENRERAGLEVVGHPGYGFYVCRWLDSGVANGGETNVDRYYMRRVNEDAGASGSGISSATAAPGTELYMSGDNLVATVANATDATLRIYSVAGQCIGTLHDGKLQQGANVIPCDGIVPGIYVATLQTADGTKTTKIIKD